MGGKSDRAACVLCGNGLLSGCLPPGGGTSPENGGRCIFIIRSRSMAIYLIVLMSTLTHAAFAGSRVVVSLYALDQGASQITIGVFMALYALCPIFIAVSVGKLADRVGPRLPMVLGSSGIVLSLLLPPLFPGLTVLFVSALLIGTAFHFFFVTVTGITGGIGGEENRVRNYAIVSLGFSGASFAGPVVAGFSIDHLGHLSAFLLLALFPALTILLLWFKGGFLTHAVKRGDGGKKHAIDLMRIPALRNGLIASGIIAAAYDLFQFYMPVYGHAMGLTASAIGMVIGFCALATFTIRVALPRLVERLSEWDVLTYAIFVAAGAFVLFPFFRDAVSLAAISFLLGLGLGCGQPMSMSLIYLLSPQGRAAESAGLRVMVNNIAHLAMPLIFGSLGSAWGFFSVFLSNSVLLVAGGVLMRWSSVRERGGRQAR
ncbi:MAG: MFS transporter [Syntrophales bacterium]